MQTPYARIFTLPNSLYGLLFYLGIAAISIYNIITGEWLLLRLATVIAILAVLLSLYLAWSLIFKLRQLCPICYASHILNIIIAAMLIAECRVPPLS